MLIALLIPVILASLFYCGLLVRAAIRRGAVPNLEAVALGAVTNFFDTLGIGSFAPTTAWLKFRGLVADRLIPCTMIVGHTPPSMVQGIIFLVLLGVFVDPVLLAGCVIALLVGGLVGAPLVAMVRTWIIQAIVAIALVIAAAFFVMANLDLMPVGGTATSLPASLLIVAVVANFAFGVLLNFGIGNYAPTLAMFSLMGMDPRLCFPIMAGGAALAGAAASSRHIFIGEVDLRIATGIAIGGIPAVLVAAFIVRSMPVEMLRWLVIAVILYAAAVMLKSAAAGRRGERSAAALAVAN